MLNAIPGVHSLTFYLIPFLSQKVGGSKFEVARLSGLMRTLKIT